MEVAGIDAVGRGERDLHIALGGSFMRLNAVAARCSSLVTASSPRRENLSMIFLRLPIPGSTVASSFV